MEQSDFLDALLRGESTALEHLYRVQFPVIRTLVREYGGSESDAKDIFQDAMLVLFKKARQPDFQLTSKLSTLFYGICRNLWLNRWTKKNKTVEVTLSDAYKYIPDEDVVLSDAGLLHLERSNLFWHTFRQLGDDCQKLLELYFQSVPMETIAVQMGYGSEGYARRRKHQCKERLVELVRNNPAYVELIGS